jgi:hypothetical protein
MPFDLKQSPFYVLGVSPRDNRSAIEEAVESLLADGILNETVALHAQQQLMSPRLRLDAELAWVPGVAPSRTHALLNGHLDEETASDLPPLASANLAAHRCSAGTEPSLYQYLLRFHARTDLNETLRVVNAERRVSGFPDATLALLEAALQQLTSRHVDALLDSILRRPQPGSELTTILECYANGPTHLLTFLDHLVERFDASAMGQAQQALAAISDKLRVFKDSPSRIAPEIGQFQSALAVWSALSAPRQCLLAKRHIKDSRTDQLLTEIKSITLHLNNELGDPASALALCEVALQAFQHSPEHLEIWTADIEVLKVRVSDSAVWPIVKPLVESVTKLQKSHSELCRSLNKGDFKPGGKRVGGALFALFRDAALNLKGRPEAMMPFRIVLSLAIELHNESNASDEALTLISALRDFQEVPADAEVATALKQNGLVAYRTILQKKLAAAGQAGQLGRAANLAKELEESQDNFEERAGWTKLRLEFERRKKHRLWKWGSVAAGLAGLIAFGSLSGGSPPSTPASTSYVSSDSKSASSPTTATVRILSASELKWCVLEVELLKRVKSLLSQPTPDSAVSAFNARLDDWRARCGSAKYYESDMKEAERMAQEAAAKLDQEARSIYATWTANSAQ